MKLKRLSAGLVVAAAVVAAGLSFASDARADDVSTQAWATASDSTLASFLETPYSTEAWGGTGQSADNLYNLASQDPYNYVQVQAAQSALEAAGEYAGGYVNPWAYVAAVPVTTVGTYVAYKAQGLWFQWIDSDWGAVASHTDVCGSADSSSSACELVPVAAGHAFCIGFNNTLGRTYNWTPPSDGFILETTIQEYQSREFAGGCSTSYNPVALNANDTTRIANVDSEYNSDFELNSGQGNLIIWYEPAPGLESSAHTPPPSNAQPSTVAAYVGQATPNGDLTSRTITPTAAQWASGLRKELTDPTDTCNGVPCGWGDNGGSPGANQTHANSTVFSCVILGTCVSSGLPCTYHARAYIMYTMQHVRPTYPGISPRPDGCWRWIDMRGHDLSNWTNCSTVNYPSLTTSGVGPSHSYDDTNPNHTTSGADDATLISNGCLNGASTTLNVEFEAPGGCTPGWVGVAPAGVTVLNYLLETYCGNGAVRDDAGLVDGFTYGSNTGGVVNVGADIPTTEGGPCNTSTTDCLGNLTSDVQAVCDYTPSGGILGLYMNYKTPQAADTYIETVNSAMNSCEY